MADVGRRADGCGEVTNDSVDSCRRGKWKGAGGPPSCAIRGGGAQFYAATALPLHWSSGLTDLVALSFVEIVSRRGCDTRAARAVKQRAGGREQDDDRRVT